MKIWSVLRRLPPILAVAAGLIAWPFAAPVAANAMAGAPTAAMAEGMPCDAHGKPPGFDCQKKCPLMAFCMTNFLQGAPAAEAASLVSRGLSGTIAPLDDAERNGLTEAPLPRPPRT